MMLEAQWIVGFVDGEGCFHVSLNPHKEMKLGYQVLPEFVVVQHKKDIQLLYALKASFKCGVVRLNHGDRMAFRVRGHTNLLKQVIPFFEKHPLRSKKKLQFLKFRDVVLIMEKGGHLTPSGLDSIKKIKSGMNKLLAEV